MADDVKVKFSGDFSDVPKGADAAVKQAGSAMSSWFGEFSKSTQASILSSLALSSIFNKFTTGISEALHYFRELDLTMRRIGGSGTEFQQLAGVGKQVGVSMEGVGRSLNFFNKYVGQAAQGSKSHTDSLLKMGYTQEQIKKGEISAIEVLSKLGDEYDQTGNDTIVAAKAMEYFGKQGSTLIPIIKMGREELQNMTKDMKVYSEETIRRLSETERQMEKFKKSLESVFYKAPLIAGGGAASYIERKAIYRGAINQVEEAGGTEEQKAKSAFQLIKTETGDDIVKLRDYLKLSIDTLERSKTVGGRSEFIERVRFLKGDIEKEIERLENAPKKKAAEEVPGEYGALAASTLQAIGGGDITSVLAGTSPMDQTAENTRQANIYLKTISEKQPVQQTDGTAAH
jgi:hypothetical protein